VTIRKRRRTRVEVRINSKPSPDAHTTRSAIEQLLKDNRLTFDVIVENRVSVPVAAGFGTSAAGTLASCLALSDAGHLSVTLNEIGRTAHVAEVLNGTGLGTVSALLYGGFVMVKEPGAPGVGTVDRLHFPRGHSIVCAYLGPIQTRDALDRRGRTRYDTLARSALRAINASPTLDVFLTESRKFGKRAGFETPRITRLISTMVSSGAIGAAQNMIGEAVHAVVEDSKGAKVLRAVRSEFPTSNVFVSDLALQGVRLLSEKAKH
jgi:pantoate kinase